MASKIRQSLLWKVALYYGVLIALLMILVGIIHSACLTLLGRVRIRHFAFAARCWWVC